MARHRRGREEEADDGELVADDDDAEEDDDESDEEEESEEEDEEGEEDERPARRRGGGSRSRHLPPRSPRRGTPPPLRRWRPRPGDAGEEDDDEASEREALERARIAAARPRSHYWRFRDSFWFAPIVAVVVIVIALAGLVAVTGNWPPVYVVQSSSMQHGSSDQIGLINTGDLVLSQRIANSSIVTYVGGLTTGYATYGEYGDVLLYEPNGAAVTPIIHRAIVYLDYNPNGTYSAPSLEGLPCGSAPNAVYRVAPSATGCGPIGLPDGAVLTLRGIGWRSATVNVSISPATLGAHGGYVTMGDNNLVDGGCTSACSGITDQAAGTSQLVEPGWIVGVARGMLPWFGALRLALEGHAGSVPLNSWMFLAISVVAFVLAAFALHYAWSSFRPLDPRRAAVQAREAEEEADEGRGSGAPSTRGSEERRRRWFWRRATEDDAEEDRGRGSPRRAHVARAARSTPRARSGRPRPSVRRAARHPRDSRSHGARRPPDDEL